MFNSPATEVIKWDPVLSGITQTLCIYAIILGSKSNLRVGYFPTPFGPS